MAAHNLPDGTLILVESPTKAKKLQGYAGAGIKVMATRGHLVDLPLKGLGVNLETMEEQYEPVTRPDGKTSAEMIATLKSEVSRSQLVLLGSDPDREGEAIAWHCLRLLKPSSHRRIELHEITERGLVKALGNQRDVDMGLVEAQRTRRVLDRGIGFIVSSALRANVRDGKSAGRVQSVALRMICERNAEIDNFKPEARHSIKGQFSQTGVDLDTWLLGTPAALGQISVAEEDPNDTDDTPGIKRLLSTTPLTAILAQIQAVPQWQVTSVNPKTTSVKPPPPFTTVDMQSSAAKELGWDGDYTMSIAQVLFENGHITYMRTDSVRVDPEAQVEALAFIATQYGPSYAPATANIFKSGDDAQGAHEAIRPTHVDQNMVIVTDKSGDTKAPQTLYTLIRNRYLASQAAAGTNNVVNTVIEDASKKWAFQGVQTSVSFDGWRKIVQASERASFTTVEPGAISLVKAEEIKKMTKPKPHFKEYSLVQELEKHGIGRPSSYANIMKVLRTRGYVLESKKKELLDTEVGQAVNAWQIKKDPKYTEIKFTANVEKALDDISTGKFTRVKLLKDLFDDLQRVYGAYHDRVPGQSDAPPTQPQIDYATKLAKDKGVTLSPEVLKTRASISAFIEANKPADSGNKTAGGSGSGPRPPTKPQLDYANGIAKNKKLTIPADALKSSFELSKWIDKNK